MALRFTSGRPPDPPQPWKLWRWDLDSRRATMYTPEQPYQRYSMSVTATRPSRLPELEADAEAKAREKGYVTFPELPIVAQEFWAEHDALWLVNTIAQYLAERE